MSNKKIGNATMRFKQLLTSGPSGSTSEGQIQQNPQKTTIPIEDQIEEALIIEDQIIADEPSATEPIEEEPIIEDIMVSGEIQIEKPITPSDVPVYTPKNSEDVDSLKSEISELKTIIETMEAKMNGCITSKEQFKEYFEIINNKNSEMGNRKLMGMLEQLSTMREDFFKLCSGMNEKIDIFSAKDVLNSFEAYGVDMENILTDCGVFIGPFKYDKLNTLHQRIVDVIPTDDESKNGMIAERKSDGYEYNGRVLFKERVNIYKFSEKTVKNEKEE